MSEATRARQRKGDMTTYRLVLTVVCKDGFVRNEFAMKYSGSRGGTMRLVNPHIKGKSHRRQVKLQRRLDREQEMYPL